MIGKAYRMYVGVANAVQLPRRVTTWKRSPPAILFLRYALLIKFFIVMKYFLYLTCIIMPLQNIVEKVPNLYGITGLGFTNILFLILLIGLFFCFRSDLEEKEYKWKLNYSLYIYLTFTFFQVFRGSGTEIYSTLDRVTYWKDVLLGMCMYFVFKKGNLTKKELISVLILMAISNLYMVIYFFRETRWMNLANIERMKLVNGTFGTMGGSNEWAAFFSVYTIVIISISMLIKKKLVKIGLYSLSALNIVVMLFSYSRGAYIGFVIGIATVLLKLKKAFFPLIILLALLGFYNEILPDSVLERINNTKSENGELDNDSKSRIAMWIYAWDGFIKNPIIGNGSQSFLYYYEYDNKTYNNPHNTHLQILYEHGIVGYIMFMFIFISVYYDNKYIFRRTNCNLIKGISLGLIGASLGLFSTNFFGNRWTYFCLTSSFWILNGLIIRMYILTDNK